MESNREREMRLLGQRAVVALEKVSEGVNTLAETVMDKADKAVDALDKLSEGLDTLTNLLEPLVGTGGGTEASEDTSEGTSERPVFRDSIDVLNYVNERFNRGGVNAGVDARVEEQQESKSLCGHCGYPRGSTWSCHLTGCTQVCRQTVHKPV